MMTWQQELKNNITDVKGLLPHMNMPEAEQAEMARILEQFPMAVTPYYLSLIDFADENDPIRKMAIPSVKESDLSGSFDTSGEASNTVVEGLQHKYRQTAMMLSTNQCAMYCRHCFRKRLVGLTDDEIAGHYAEMREYILAHKEISCVLVSGGDSLLNSNARLGKILSMLVDIEHLDSIRIATRVPVVFPSRITTDGDLLDMLAKFNAKKQLIMVTQYNHPRELTEESLAAVKAVQKAGIPVKNQAVLLRGINDSPEVLGSLLRGLVRAGIAPYYVFQCRPVSGVKNQFQVPLQKGVDIVQAAKNLQSGVGKTFRYCMSHVTGKIEILGRLDDKILFQYHEAHDPARLGKIFAKDIAESATWFDVDDPLA